MMSLSASRKKKKSWDEFGVCEEVEDCGQKLINTNWVLVMKEGGVKARLCLHGDQEPDYSFRLAC